MKKRDSHAESIEEHALRENEEEAARRQALAEMSEGTAQIAEETPDKFFAFATALRGGVETFNATIVPSRRLYFRESAALTCRDRHPGAELNLTFGRRDVEVFVALHELNRIGVGRLGAYVIQGSGKFKVDRFHFRIEGHFERGSPGAPIRYRISIDYQPVECSVEQFAERLVLAAVKEDRELLTQSGALSGV